MTHHHHSNPEHLGSRRGLDRKLDHITERLKHMATDEQVSKLATDVEALLKAIADKQPPAPPAQTADPAIDALDEKVKAATASLAPPAPAAPSDPAAPAG